MRCSSQFSLIVQLHLDKPARLSFSCSLNLPLNILSNKCIKRLETALGCLTSPHFLRSDILSPSSLASLLLKKTSSSFDQLPPGVWDRHIFHGVFAEPEFQGPGWQNIWYGLAFWKNTISWCLWLSWCLSYGLSHGQQIWYRPSVIWKKHLIIFMSTIQLTSVLSSCQLFQNVYQREN